MLHCNAITNKHGHAITRQKQNKTRGGLTCLVHLIRLAKHSTQRTPIDLQTQNVIFNIIAPCLLSI